MRSRRVSVAVGGAWVISIPCFFVHGHIESLMGRYLYIDRSQDIHVYILAYFNTASMYIQRIYYNTSHMV